MSDFQQQPGRAQLNKTSSYFLFLATRFADMSLLTTHHRNLSPFSIFDDMSQTCSIHVT
jgi:hypothetical protein